MDTVDTVVIDTSTGDTDVGPVDADGDGATADVDCNDADPTVHPGAVETCDGVDQDCNGLVDDGAVDPTPFHADGDGDAYGDPNVTIAACSAPAGFVADATDCDDHDATVHPGAEEADCTDPVDRNCDGSVGRVDADGDGVPACEDCDDTRASVNPQAPEVCDGRDDDCDGSIDEAGAYGEVAYHADADGDGFGAAPEVLSCAAPDASQAWVTSGDDCDDALAAVHPGATETCDGRDDDCDGVIDDHPSDATTYYADADGDGYGVSGSTVLACARPSGFSDTPGDCDDGSASANPGGTEVCNGHDDDCNGQVDESTATDATMWYPDADHDLYGSITGGVVACAQPSGFVAATGDCDDALASVHPGGVEVCDTHDNDCNGVIDDAAADAATWYRDADADTYGVATQSTRACAAPSGYVGRAGDCDDGSAAINPTTIWHPDVDGDTYGDSAVSQTTCAPGSGWVLDGTDCNDRATNAYVGHAEIWYDGVDEACDGGDDFDQDGDGAKARAYGGTDCNDTDASHVTCAGDATTALRDCREVLDVLGASAGDGTYWIKPESTAFAAYCDLTTDGGGWTLVARVADGSTALHRDRGAVGALTSPVQTTTAKLADVTINALRGSDYTSSILRMQTTDAKVDYFREARAFDALGLGNSINRVYDTYSDALGLTAGCNGQEYPPYHTGLVGWTCYDYMIYADNPGFRDQVYQGGTVWVKRL